MIHSMRVAKVVGRLMPLATLVLGSVAANASSPQFDLCSQAYRLWARYETANCPNQSGQRAQAEWAMDRCHRGDLDRGLGELTRLLERDLIPLPRIEPGNDPAGAERK